MMGGGGGGGRYDRPITDSIRRKIEQAQQQERQRLDNDLNALLQRLLARFNDRDTETTAARLESLRTLLGTEAEVESVLLGGSVAKHTDVDGISDVDALIILDPEHSAGKTPEELLETFRVRLNQDLPRSEIKSVEKGRLAITITYLDDSQVQILPAIRSGGTLSIPSTGGRDWAETNPGAFHQELSRQNARLNQALVPAIKLVKALVAGFPEQKQLSGYHVEALALDAVRGFRGPATPKSLVLHLLENASSRVLAPIEDVTGQSRTVDAYLGAANSAARRSISQALSGMKNRLSAATTVQEWQTVFED